MLDRIRSLFSPQEITVPVDQATEQFAREREQDLATARKQAETFHTEICSAVDAVKKRLAPLEDYADPDGHAMVEDVVQNVARDRQRLLDEFDPDPHPTSLYEDTSTLIEEFQTLTQKEAAIMDRVGDDASNVFTALKQVKRQHDHLATFLDTEYQVLEQYTALQDAVADWEQIRDRITELEQERESINTQTLRTQIKEKQDELEQHQEKDAWDDYRRLNEQINDLETEQDTLTTAVETAAQKMERGLKKLLYEAEQGTVTLSDTHQQALEDIRSGDVLPGLWDEDGATQFAAAAATATQLLPEDLLGERQQRKFNTGAETLQTLPEKQERLQDIQDDIQQRQDQINNFSLEQEEQQLRQELADLQKQLEELTAHRTTIKNELDEQRQKYVDRRADIEALLNDALRPTVRVE